MTFAVAGCMGDDGESGTDDGENDDSTSDGGTTDDGSSDDGSGDGSSGDDGSDDDGMTEDPASFQVENLDPAEATVEMGAELTVSADISNSGDQSGTKAIELRLDGETLASQDLSLDGGASETVSFDANTAELDPGEYTHSIWTEDDEATGTLTLEEVVPATFEVANLDPEEATAAVGDLLTVSGDITNSGDEEGTKAVELRIGEETIGTQELTLGAGSSQSVSFEADTSPLEAGEYEHSIWTEDDEVAGSLTLDVSTVPAAVQFSEPAVEGGAITADFGRLDDGGFMVIHDSRFPDQPLESVVGVSTYLEPGEHDAIAVELTDTPEDGEEIVAMPHRDSNGNETYDFVDSGGDADPPYQNAEGAPVTASAVVTVPPTVADAVEEANAIVEEVNNGDPSLSTTNEQLENVASVGLVDPVEAGTVAEAGEEAQRLRDEVERIKTDLFTLIPEEINAQSNEQFGFDLIDPENIPFENSDGMRDQADEVEGLSEEAAAALNGGADLADGIEAALNNAADILDSAVEG